MLIEEIISSELSEDWKKSMYNLAGAGALAAASVTPGSPPAEPVAKVQTQEGISLSDILAMTIWGEARGTGTEGMEAVAHVIKNRAEANKPKLFGDGIKGVMLKPKQFSFWNDTNPSILKKRIDRLAGKDKLMWDQAKRIATQILSDDGHDPTKGAVYYHTTAINPYWAKSLEPVAKIGGHIFYRN